MDPTTRAAFILVSVVLGIQLIIVVAGASACLFYVQEIVAGSFVCDKGDRLIDLMAEIRAAALGFAGGVLAKSVAPPGK